MEMQNLANILRCLTLMGALLLPAILPAQVLPFKTYTQRDGLISKYVHTIVQDTRGYLWIGAGEGLSIYDGYEFDNHRSSGNQSLHSILTLSESRTHGSGSMWIGTHLGGGLVLFSRGSFTPFAQQDLRGRSISSVVEDAAGNVWCATDSGLYRIASGETSAHELNSQRTHQVTAPDDRTILALLQSSLRRYSLSGEFLDSLGIPGATCMLAGQGGRLWVATGSRELLQITDMSVRERIPLPSGRVKGMSQDADGTVWLASSQGLMKVLHGGDSSYSVTTYTAAHGLASTDIHDVHVDREENLWIATWGGLQMLPPNATTLIPIDTLPFDRFYQPLAVDVTGRFWAVTVGGILELTVADSLTHTFHGESDLRLSSQPTGVKFDHQGRLWVADGNRVFHVYDVNRMRGSTTLTKRRQFQASISDERTRLIAFLPDRKGNLWCSLSPVGVAVFDSTFRHLRTLTQADGLRAGDMRDMMQDRRGRVWLGGMGGGIIIADGGPSPLTFLQAQDGLPDEMIRSLHQDREGRIVIGTRIGGLVRYDDTTFTQLTNENGLISDCVWGIAEDNVGRYWLATQAGLQSVDKASFTPNASPAVMTGEATIACAVNEDVVAAYRYGSILIVSLKDRKRVSVAPPIHITKFLVNGEPVDTREAHRFSYSMNTCALEFTGIQLSDAKALRYQYRILEADTNWSAASSDRGLTLPNLAPGQYTIEVQAVTAQGLESSHPASVAFTILPPPWRSWWAYGMYALIALAGGFAWRRYEINRIRREDRLEAERRENALRIELEKQQTRMQIARDLHDEVGSTLSSITLFAQAIAEKKSNDKRLLSLISEGSSRAKEAMRDIIWSLDAANDDWETMLVKFRRFASDLLENKRIEHSIDLDIPSSASSIDPHRRRHFWLLFKELVANIVNHSQCGQAQISLTMKEGVLCLRVEDNGRGFNEATVNAGNGIKNIRSRAATLGGTAELSTTPGGGTRWKVSFPLFTNSQKTT